MSQAEIYLMVLVGLVLVIAIAIYLTMRRHRSDGLRARYGEEYDRTVEAAGGRAPAEANLAAREKRVKELAIRPLTENECDEFVAEWRDVKAVFVDSPAEAVLHADRMLTQVMQVRGFPMADFDRRYEDLSVNYPTTAQHYRAGNAIAERQGRGQATTEELRQAMKHYETLLDEMVRETGAPLVASANTRVATPGTLA